MSSYLPTCSLTPCTKKMQAAGFTRSLGIQELWDGLVVWQITGERKGGRRYFARGCHS